VVDAAGLVWLVTPWIDGDVGARWLDTPERAQALARAMGTLLRSVRVIEPSTAEPETLDRGAWSNRFDDRGELDASVAAALDQADEFLADRASAPAVFVHGDYAPINAIVGDNGAIRALLDFEHARSGDPLDDVAWWGWVVRHHHPDAWRAAWGTFCTSADVDLDRDEPLLRALMVVQLYRRAMDASDAAAREGWLERLAEAATW
jgi:aminoglycoside phosphotransferase (APT) family kinase protein